MTELNFPIEDGWRDMPLSRILRGPLGFSALGRRALREAGGGLLLDGCPVPPYALPAGAAVLTVRLPEDPPSPIPPAAGPLNVLYEDEHLLVVDKPAGMAVHPGPGHHGDTLGNRLAWHYARRGENHLFRPVNRLDRGTSGLMCVAKHGYAAQQLGRALEQGRFRKEYLAICQGVPDPLAGRVEAPIGRREGSVLERQVRPDGKRAVTNYRALSGRGGRCLLRVRPETGRTHQIRVHMAWLGHPLTGDFLYGAEALEVIGRTALHAETVAFVHPVTSRPLAFRSPLPEDMARLV